MTTQMKEDVSAWPSSNPVFKPVAEGDAERRIRVAFAEDDNDFRDAVAAELGDYGFDVTAFPDGTQLLDAFANGIDAEIILLDWSMPSMEGIDLLPKLRHMGILLPVVFLTGRTQPVYEKQALDRGALDFVDKSRGVPILHRGCG